MARLHKMHEICQMKGSNNWLKIQNKHHHLLIFHVTHLLLQLSDSVSSQMIAQEAEATDAKQPEAIGCLPNAGKQNPA